jgi:hypothetical protein
MRMAFVKLIEPRDPGELAFIRSLLDGNGIFYTVRGEYFSSLYSGVSALACSVMVEEWEFDRAAVLLSKLHDDQSPELDAG